MLRTHLFIGLAVSVLASTAYGQASFVGKKMSVASSSSTPVVVPAYPATVTIVSVGVPEKYKSKKNILAISTSVQESCSGDSVYGILTVGGINAEPDPTGSFFRECSNNNSYEMFAREWFLVPESAGGPVIAPGATVDLLLSSDSGTSQAGVAALQAGLAK